jgi:hypothetical protein
VSGGTTPVKEIPGKLRVGAGMARVPIPCASTSGSGREVTLPGCAPGGRVRAYGFFDNRVTWPPFRGFWKHAKVGLHHFGDDGIALESSSDHDWGLGRLLGSSCNREKGDQRRQTQTCNAPIQTFHVQFWESHGFSSGRDAGPRAAGGLTTGPLCLQCMFSHGSMPAQPRFPWDGSSDRPVDLNGREAELVVSLWLCKEFSRHTKSLGTFV